MHRQSQHKLQVLNNQRLNHQPPDSTASTAILLLISLDWEISTVSEQLTNLDSGGTGKLFERGWIANGIWMQSGFL